MANLPILVDFPRTVFALFLTFFENFGSSLHRGSGTLPYLTQPPSRQKTLTDTYLEKKKT